MKKILLFLLSLSCLALCSANVLAYENHIILGKDDNILSSSDINSLNEDLDYILDNYGIDFKLIYDYSMLDDEVIDRGNNVIENDNATYSVVLCINENYYYFAYSDSCSKLLDGLQESLWELYLEEDTYYQAIKNVYQKIVSVINSEFYESDTILVSGTPKLYDRANLLTEVQFKELEKNLIDVSNKYKMDVIILLTDSLNGMTARNYADDYYDYNGYKDDGILFMLAMNEREWYVSTKGSAIDYISDGTIDTVVDKILDDLSSGNYFEALMTYSKKIDQALEYGINHNGSDYHERDYALNFTISGIIASVVTLIVYLVLNGQLKSVRTNNYAGDYIVKDSFRLTGYSDFFLRKEVTKTAKQSSSSSSSGSHSSHTSSSGSSHGGHGGRF